MIAKPKCEITGYTGYNGYSQVNRGCFGDAEKLHAVTNSLLQFLHGIACRKQRDIHGTRASSSSPCVNDWRIGDGLAFACAVEGEWVVEGACMSEA